MTETPNPDTKPATAPEEQGSKARQLLGMKGAAGGETSIWKIRLQLMKPITWIPLIWGGCLRGSILRWLCVGSRRFSQGHDLYVVVRAFTHGLYPNP